jgi:cytochrome bd-type quinol oxidase subunit 2
VTDREFFDRVHFASTISYHYLFPQLTMGLALLIVVLKTLGLRRNESRYDDAARFWARIFGINFVMGVVTGVPMSCRPLGSARDLTIANTQAPYYGLSVGLIWWGVGISIAIAYFIFVYRMFRGRVPAAPPHVPEPVGGNGHG